MKRVFALVIALCLMLPVLPGVAEEKKLHLLWDIPFDTPMEEFVELAYEKAGIVYEVTWEQGDAITQKSVKGQEITFFGYPVKEAYVSTKDKNAGIKAISFFFMPYEASDDSFSNLLSQADDIFARFTQAYGSVEHGYIELDFGYDASGKVIPSRSYEYPFTADGQVDHEKVTALFTMVSEGQIAMIYSRWIWNNVSVVFVFHRDSDYSRIISKTAMAWESVPMDYDKAPLAPMPWKSGEPKATEKIDLGL